MLQQDKCSGTGKHCEILDFQIGGAYGKAFCFLWKTVFLTTYMGVHTVLTTSLVCKPGLQRWMERKMKDQNLET